MLRPNLTNLCNPNAPERDFDRIVRKTGGTLFTNCFTPSPDTPRSLGCFWSGQTPWRNGCDSKLKYPRYFLKTPSFLDLLHERDYELNFFSPPLHLDLGILPDGYVEKGRHNQDMDLKKYLSETTFSDNSFTFISLPDFHWALDDLINTMRGVEQGLYVLADCLEIIVSAPVFECFDYVLIFSDHGCKIDSQFRTEEKYQLMNRDRTNIFMYLREKGQAELIYNDKLCSIVDIYPTICDILKIPYVADCGYSLRSPHSHDYIIAEDSGTFTAEVRENMSLWAVIRQNGFYFRDLERRYFYENESTFDLPPEHLDELIAENSTIFHKYLKAERVLSLYKNMNNYAGPYSNGDARVLPFAYRAYQKKKQKYLYLLSRVLKRLIRGRK